MQRRRRADAGNGNFSPSAAWGSSMLRALLLFVVFAATPAAAQEYQSKDLADAARDWRQELIDSVPANKKQPGLVAGLRRTARD